MKKTLLNSLTELSKQQAKGFAVLLDPDKVAMEHLPKLVQQAQQHGVTYWLVGGSLIAGNELGNLVAALKTLSTIPVILFPGSNHHIEPLADGILLLSLISGRNAEFLIGQHVVAAPMLQRSGLEILPTGYMLVHSGAGTTVSYISNTTPIPADKASIAACTAMAGEMLGLRLMYLDGGSGAQHPVPPSMVAAVRRSVSTPLWVGGGIRSAAVARDAWQAGADVVVVGNGIEDKPELLQEIGRMRQHLSPQLQQA